MQDALSAQQLNRSLARGMWMDVLLREHWHRERDDRRSEEREKARAKRRTPKVFASEALNVQSRIIPKHPALH